MKTKSFLICVAITLICSFLFGCSSDRHAYKYSGATKKSSKSISSSPNYAYSDVSGTNGTTGTSYAYETSTLENTDANNTDRKMIYNASVSMTVKNPDSVNVHLVAIAKKYKGYVLNTGYSYTTIRVTADSLQQAIKEISKLGKVSYKSITGEDITDEYADLGIRLVNAQKARTRYLELLEKAANVDETLKVEKELERLNNVIDLLEGKMNRLNQLEQYSTITVNMQKKVKPGPVMFIFKYLFKGVKFLFVWN